MATVRMQSRYWKMIHHSIELAKKQIDSKLKRLDRNEVMAKSNGNAMILEKIANERHFLREDLERYVAIDKLVVAAGEKKDGFFSSGIGPDEEHYESLQRNDEEYIKFLEQLD